MNPERTLPDDKEETSLEEKEKKGTGTIVALIALIVVLFVGIKLVFYGIGVLIPQDDLKESASQSVTQEETVSQGEQVQQTQQAPAFCPYCGQELFEGFQWGQFCPYCGEKVEQG